MFPLDLSIVELHIRPLVAAMNVEPLVATIASCEGHWRPFGLCEAPYVYFRASVEVASEFEKRLRSACWYCEPSRLKYHWRLAGGFNEAFELRFTLEPTNCDRLLLGPHAFRIALNSDFLALVRLLEDALSEVRKHRVDNVKPGSSNSESHHKSHKRASLLVAERIPSSANGTSVCVGAQFRTADRTR